MSTTVQFRRGTATQNQQFRGAAGEITIDMDNFQLRVHDLRAAVTAAVTAAATLAELRQIDLSVISAA